MKRSLWLRDEELSLSLFVILPSFLITTLLLLPRLLVVSTATVVRNHHPVLFTLFRESTLVSNLSLIVRFPPYSSVKELNAKQSSVLITKFNYHDHCDMYTMKHYVTN